MGILRNRDRTPDGAVRYQIREKVLSIGDDSWVDDADGNHVFKVNGKAARLRRTIVLEDMEGRDVAHIKGHPVHIRDTMTITFGGGREATVKKALVGIRSRFHVDVEGGEELRVKGNVVDHEYEVEQDGHTVATVSKKWFRVRDTFGVEILQGANPILVLATAIAIDELTGRD